MEGMQATHQTKMDQMSSRVKQLGSCQVEQLSVFVGAVIQDVQMFMQARQKVDSLEDHLKINEKETNEDEAAHLRFLLLGPADDNLACFLHTK